MIEFKLGYVWNSYRARGNQSLFPCVAFEARINPEGARARRGLVLMARLFPLCCVCEKYTYTNTVEEKMDISKRCLFPLCCVCERKNTHIPSLFISPILSLSKWMYKVKYSYAHSLIR